MNWCYTIITSADVCFLDALLPVLFAAILSDHERTVVTQSLLALHRIVKLLGIVRHLCVLFRR